MNKPASTIVQVGVQGDMSQSTSKINRVLMEWVFSLRHQLSRSRQQMSNLESENERLKQQTENELLQFLGQLKRDAKRVNKTVRVRDEKILSLRNECHRLHSENLLLKSQLEASLKMLNESSSQTVKQLMHSSRIATTPATNTLSNSTTSRFGKNIMLSLKSRLGRLGSSSRKLEHSHRDKFRSVDTIASITGSYKRRDSTPVDIENKPTLPVAASVADLSTRQPLQASPDVNKLRPAPPRPRKARVSISDPPARSDCLVAAQVLEQHQQKSQAVFAAQSCGDIISLSEEAELENSVSPLVLGLSSADSSPHFNDSAVGSCKDSNESDDEEADDEHCSLRRHSDMVERNFGNRQARYSRRKFDFKRKYSSTHHIAGAFKQSLKSAVPMADESSSTQLFRSKSSPSQAVEVVRSKHQGNQAVKVESDRSHDEGEENGTTPSIFQASSSPRMVGSHSFAGREVLVV